MDHGNTGIERFQRILKLNFLTFKYNLARCGRMDTDQTFHQGRFTCTVLAHQRVHGTGPYLQLYALECAYTREFLDNIGHLEDIFLAHCFSPHYLVLFRKGTSLAMSLSA